MINKILRKEIGNDIFERIIDDFLEDSYSEHRRGSNFFTNSIAVIDEEYFPELDREYDGYWETSQYISDSEYGTDRAEIYELNRVEKKEIVKTTTEWVRVKD